MYYGVYISISHTTTKPDNYNNKDRYRIPIKDQNPNENSEKLAEQVKGIAEGVTLAGYSSNVSPNLQYQLEKLDAEKITEVYY